MHEHSHETRGTGGPGKWAFWAFLAIAAFFLVAEHRAHLYQYWPYLLLAACPVLHLFHGHGGHRRKNGEDKRQ